MVCVVSWHWGGQTGFATQLTRKLTSKQRLGSIIFASDVHPSDSMVYSVVSYRKCLSFFWTESLPGLLTRGLKAFMKW